MHRVHYRRDRSSPTSTLCDPNLSLEASRHLGDDLSLFEVGLYVARSTHLYSQSTPTSVYLFHSGVVQPPAVSQLVDL